MRIIRLQKKKKNEKQVVADDSDIFGENERKFCNLAEDVSFGEYILVKFCGGKRNGKTFKYFCAVHNVYNDKEIEVACMQSINENK